MSFKLAVTPDFSALINAEIPADNGRAQKVSFHVRFKRLSTTEFEAMVNGINAKDENGNRTIQDQDIVDQVLTGFGDDLQDDNGNPLEFTPGNVAALCDVHPLRSHIVQGFFDNYVKAKAKN
ncbi:MAG: phage tail assembly chaperone [Rhodoferax sp.]|nr:phage tail assembly chaperone [Rhodoferax sp.]MDP3652418.1 phage tail assembly chaperone [Rhodoferax sp.]